MIMVGYFLLLYGAVGFIQDKRFFFSAPKENFAAIPERKERFRGAHIIGWFIIVIAFLIFIGGIVLGIWDGVRNDFSFLKFSVRFLVMLYAMEVYDMSSLIGCCSVTQTSFPIFIQSLKV